MREWWVGEGSEGRALLQVTPHPIGNLYPPLIHTHDTYITAPVCRLRVDHIYDITIIYYYIIVNYIYIPIKSSTAACTLKKIKLFRMRTSVGRWRSHHRHIVYSIAVWNPEIHLRKYYSYFLYAFVFLSLWPAPKHRHIESEIRFFDNDITRWVYTYYYILRRRGDNYTAEGD